MTTTPAAAPIIVLSPDSTEAIRIAGWLRGAGLGAISTARTCDEAIFMLGRGRPSLLMIDERVPERAEQRLLRHIEVGGSGVDPALVRLIGETSQGAIAAGRRVATEIIQKPLTAHDVVFRVGTAMQRPDLIGRLDHASDQSAQNLAVARQMQIGLLPTADQLRMMRDSSGVGVAALYHSGEAVGGDFWGIWPTGRGRFALTIVDFVGHGLSAALNTFRLHALLSDETLPRGRPKRMTTVLNERLHALLPRGQYATMMYLQIDPISRGVVWCGAGGPPPMFVTADQTYDLQARGLPLGVRAGTTYQSRWMRLPDAGVLAVFSDGLFESGAQGLDIPRSAMAGALIEPARMAATGDLAAAAEAARAELEALRERYPSPGHSDDVMAICVAFGPMESKQSFFEKKDQKTSTG